MPIRFGRENCDRKGEVKAIMSAHDYWDSVAEAEQNRERVRGKAPTVVVAAWQKPGPPVQLVAPPGYCSCGHPFAFGVQHRATVACGSQQAPGEPDRRHTSVHAAVPVEQRTPQAPRRGHGDGEHRAHDRVGEPEGDRPGSGGVG